MVSKPEQWVNDFAAAGADQYTFHIEATEDPVSLAKLVRAKGMKVGVSVKPKTPATAIEHLVREGLVDTVLVMSVEPGFGGQSFMPEAVPKIAEIRSFSKTVNISVDGGIALNNIEQVAAAGANVAVAGSSIFGAKSPQAVISEMHSVLLKHLAAA